MPPSGHITECGVQVLLSHSVSWRSPLVCFDLEQAGCLNPRIQILVAHNRSVSFGQSMRLGNVNAIRYGRSTLN